MEKKGAKKEKPSVTAPNASPPRPRRVTTIDVARCAGVSQATVSLVLSNRRNVRIPESTRDRIKKCAEELGYLPSLLGEGFLRGRSKIIGVILYADTYPPLVDSIAGIQAGLAQNDYVSIVLSSYWEEYYAKRGCARTQGRSDELTDVRRLLEHQVEGVLCFSTDPRHFIACQEEFIPRQVPMVAVGIDYPAANVDFVSGDNQAIGVMAADHLLSVGCTSFIFAETPLFPPITKIVKASFCERIKASGYPCAEIAVDGGKSDKLIHDLSKAICPPTGIFAITQSLAALSIQAATSLGLRVPGDVAVVGTGSAKVAQYSLIPMTRVNRNAFVTGQQAVELLIKRINGDTSPIQKILIPPTLEIGESSMRIDAQGSPAKALDRKANYPPTANRKRNMKS